MNKTHKALSEVRYIDNPYNDFLMDSPGKAILGYPYNDMSSAPQSYQDEIKQCRYFYRTDPMASTVINRICEIGVTNLRHRRSGASDEELYFYTSVAQQLMPLIEHIALEYFITGMAIPDYVTDRKMGSRIDPRLGRKRYVYPRSFWIRNPENIILKRIPVSNDRAVYLQVPQDEIYFVKNKGVYKDGTEDRALYERMAREFPEYVEMIHNDKTVIPLPHIRPVMRKPMPTQDYPQPFLVPALAALKHKQRIKKMDYSLATKVLDSIRLVRAGSDEHPVTEDDPMLDELRQQMNNREVSRSDVIYTLFTNHTVQMEWICPPLEALLSEDKYNAPNSDILFAFGFSRILLVGENERSNASHSNNSVVGPISTIHELQRTIIRWLRALYTDLAEQNGFSNIPTVTFSPIPIGDINSLAAFAMEAVKEKAVSRDTIAKFFNTSFEEEIEQIHYEDSVIPTSNTTNPQQAERFYEE